MKNEERKNEKSISLHILSLILAITKVLFVEFDELKIYWINSTIVSTPHVCINDFQSMQLHGTMGRRIDPS